MEPPVAGGGRPASERGPRLGGAERADQLSVEADHRSDDADRRSRPWPFHAAAGRWPARWPRGL